MRVRLASRLGAGGTPYSGWMRGQAPPLTPFRGTGHPHPRRSGLPRCIVDSKPSNTAYMLGQFATKRGYVDVETRSLPIPCSTWPRRTTSRFATVRTSAAPSLAATGRYLEAGRHAWISAASTTPWSSGTGRLRPGSGPSWQTSGLILRRSSATTLHSRPDQPIRASRPRSASADHGHYAELAYRQGARLSPIRVP
jgi:hypothetical protein